MKKLFSNLSIRRTRTSTPVTHRPEDEITQSSMDESDDADMTDDESSGEEWSDVDGNLKTSASYITYLSSTYQDSSRAQPTSSLMTFYSPIVRHYAFNWGHDIRSWDIPAFSQTKASIYHNETNLSPPYFLNRQVIPSYASTTRKTLATQPRGLRLSTHLRIYLKMRMSLQCASNLSKLYELFLIRYCFKQ